MKPDPKTPSQSKSDLVPDASSADNLDSSSVHAVMTYPGQAIRFGWTGKVVKVIQERLNFLGFHSGTVDGDFGPITKGAVSAFQAANHLAVSGIVGPHTWQALFDTSAHVVPMLQRIQAFLKGSQADVSVSVYDANNGQTYDYNPLATFDTASIVKVSIMGTLLRQAEVSKTPLSAEEELLMSPMIEYSNNDDATALWNRAGGGSAVQSFMNEVGMSNTAANTEGYWGLTQTSAPDEVSLVKDFAYPNPLLSYSMRLYGLDLMQNVTSWERWGVSAGVESGSTVALKNGWLPIGPDDWVVNSIGLVKGDGRNYVIAVLTEGSATENDGIATIQGVSNIVWRYME